MNRAVLGCAVVCGILGTVLGGCGPAPYAIEPDDAPPAPPRVEQVPVVIVQQQPAAVVTLAPPLPQLPDVITATLRRYYPRFHKCYAKALHHDRSLRGSTLVRVVIDSDGEVSSAKDWGGDIPDRKLRECIVDVYEDMEFPTPAANRVFVHPLQFEPSRHGGIVR